ncbi:MAG: isoprenylcysteine carboxylmethyltransferase family protein [Thermoproteota archaeon]|nr:isoprenylcysteine carboxylmethyltransferase family protein [Thermoproteota archaeon]
MIEQQPPPVESAEHVIRHNSREIPLWSWLAVIAYMVLVDNLMPSQYEGWAIVAGWFAASVMCLVNYNSCGRYHCKITGLGFLGLGVLAILEEIGVIDLEAWVTWTTLFVVLAVGFGLEYRYKSKSGSSYVVACGSKACSSSGGGDEFCMNNNDEGDHARMYKYVPGSTLGASIITAIVLHYLFPIATIIPFPYNLLGLVIVGLGVYLAFQSVRLLISHNTTFEAGGNPSSLVTRRPYSYSRNPIYLGFLLIALGTATSLSSLSAFIAPIIFFLVVNTIIIPFEENRLQKNFGIEYEKYKASVRRWL